MLFEQDGYKTFGEKIGGGFLLQICYLMRLDGGEHFYRGGGGYVSNSSFQIFAKMHFSEFCGIFKEGWYKKMKK